MGQILPELAGKLDGMAICVPVPDGSCVDLVTVMRRPVTAVEVNEVIRSAAATWLRRIVEYTDQPIVSSDVIGNSHSAVVVFKYFKFNFETWKWIQNQ